MRFLAPQFLHLAWLALIPLALYLFRKKARLVPVSTLLFFRSLAREHQESAWWRRIKKWLSLLLTLLIIWLAVLALARPAAHSNAPSPGAVILMIDRSASMAARDNQGESRLEVAKKLVRQQLRGLPEGTVISLVAFDATSEVLLSRNGNRRECLRLLEDLQPLPAEGRPELAWMVAKQLADLEPFSQIWHFGDETLGRSAEKGNYQFTSVALPEVINAGITAFQIRPSPLSRNRYEAFVQVSAARANTHAITATLEVTMAGRLAQLRELDLAPGEQTSLILPLEGVRGQRLELVLKTPGDALGWDDGVASMLPEARPLVVAWVTERPDPFTELAMTSIIEAGRIELLRGSPANWPLSEKPDVYVFEQWLPEIWPTDRPALVLNPHQSSGPVKIETLPGAGLPQENVRATGPDHPVLFRVSPTRLAITQTSLLQTGTGLEPLWMAGNEPVLAAGDIQGQRVVVTTFSPAKSEQLALLPAFPLLLGNALYWCAEGRDSSEIRRVARPGELVDEKGLIQWTEWTGSRFQENSQSVSAGLLAIRKIGTWQTSDGRSGTSVLASAKESDLPIFKMASQNADVVGTQSLPPVAATSHWGNLPRLLMWGLLGLLLLESFLFHRKAVF